MKTLATTPDMKAWSRNGLAEGLTIGFVPTMGFLHEGHLSLMRKARAENDLLVASIFVNPTQFGPGEDFATYPRDPDSDSQKCEQCGVDALFLPAAQEIYPKDFQTFVDVTEVSRPMCGASRPGHFRGVATVVTKLFNIVMPTNAYFGKKDFQQLCVISTMVRELDMNVRIVPCDTVRETDGLAMSSRNARLTGEQRSQAVCLYHALAKARELFGNGETDPERYLVTMRERIHQAPDATIDYVNLVDPDSLRDLNEVSGKALAAMAVRFGQVRLIDNMILE
jgi:pantoate--beta-alanine ligase